MSKGKKPADVLDFLKRKKPLVYFCVTFIVLLAILVLGSYGYAKVYEDRIFQGIRVGGISVGGLTREEAEKRVVELIRDRKKDGYVFVVDGKALKLPLKSADKEIIDYNISRTVQGAFLVGRQDELAGNILDRYRLLIQPSEISLSPTIDAALAQRALQEMVAPYITDSKDAGFDISFSKNTSTPVFAIRPERIGKSIDLRQGSEMLTKQAEVLNFKPITLEVVRAYPAITAAKLESKKENAGTMLSFVPFHLEAQRHTWKVDKSLLASWIGAVVGDDGEIQIVLIPEKVSDSLAGLAGNLLQEPKDGTLVMDGEVLKSFEAPIVGKMINATATVQNINLGWAAGSSTIPLAIDSVTPLIKGSDAERLGIREVLGTGRSNFSGSPTNRRKNMELGVKKMNGVLLAPGEEFSQLKTLGSVDQAHGWLPELVIKGSETTPEYGGGLCQVGTTSFRAALDAGLKITERRNHSYRVRYYEPVGTDATIYEPSPDFRFKNDTATYILITAAIEKGDDMVFTIWGTRDGREAEQTNYRVWGITPAPPTKYIETTDLAPGKIKCTETAHAGASASFDYTVTFGDGTTSTQNFQSYYKPWPAVCLKGVEGIKSDNPE